MPALWIWPVSAGAWAVIGLAQNDVVRLAAKLAGQIVQPG